MYCLAQIPPLLSLQVRNLRSKVTQDTNLHTLNPWPDPQGTACPGPAGLVTECSRQGDRAYIHSGILTLGPSREDWPPHPVGATCQGTLAHPGLSDIPLLQETLEIHIWEGGGGALHNVFQGWLT